MSEWFDQDGLRFSCTMCGNCCSGPSGVVQCTEIEIAQLAERLKLDRAEFVSKYTEVTSYGRSLVETRTPDGFDCVFLDRASIPGKAVCSVYEDRPAQCRTWPFWKRTLKSPDAWGHAKKTCPGMGTGQVIAPEDVRIRRDASPI